jgi:hypothetical protein
METDSDVKRPSFLELIYGVLFNPGKTFKNLSDAPPLGQAAAILFILAVSNTIVSYAFFRSALAEIPGAGELSPLITGLFPLMLVFGVVFAGLKWFVFGAVLHFMAELLGGKGTPKGTLTVYALAGLPGVFLVPVELLLKLLRAPENAAAALGGAAGLAVLVWGIVLLVIGLREIHRISTGNAVLTIITPVTVLSVVSVVFLLTMIGTLVPLVHSLGMT